MFVKGGRTLVLFSRPGGAPHASPEADTFARLRGAMRRITLNSQANRLVANCRRRALRFCDVLVSAAGGARYIVVQRDLLPHREPKVDSPSL